MQGLGLFSRRGKVWRWPAGPRFYRADTFASLETEQDHLPTRGPESTGQCRARDPQSCGETSL